MQRVFGKRTLDEQVQDEILKMAQAEAKKFAGTASSAFGSIVAMLCLTPPYTDYKLADLQWLVGPAVLSGQFAMMESQAPVPAIANLRALALWARVGPAVDQRLTAAARRGQRLELGPQDWESGEQFWLIEAMGDSEALAALVGNLCATTFHGHVVKARSRDAAAPDGLALIDCRGELRRGA